MQQKRKGGIGNRLIVAFALFSAITAAQVLCTLFAPAGLIIPVSVGALVAVGLISAYTYVVMQRKVVRRLNELSGTAADIAAGNFKESTPVYDRTWSGT